MEGDAGLIRVTKLLSLWRGLRRLRGGLRRDSWGRKLSIAVVHLIARVGKVSTWIGVIRPIYW
jgi:hypothetical protein